MIYFVNQYLMALNSGVEHAELKRLAMFKRHGVAAKLVTRDFDVLLHQNMAHFHVAATDMVNLYDFFRGSQQIKSRVLKITDLNLAPDYNVDPGANVSHVREGDQLIADVYFTPGTVGHLYYVNYYDALTNLVQRTYFDCRGFKAATQFFSPTGQLISDLIYNLDGSRLFERYYTTKQQLIAIRLLNYHGQDWQFDSENDLMRFFLNELNRVQPGIFIADRPLAADWPVINMKTTAHKFVWLPTTHANDPQDQVFSNMNGAYVYALHDHLAALDGVITATQQQRADLIRWLGDKPLRPITAIPAATVAPKTLAAPKVPLTARTAGKIIFVGRLDATKRLGQLLAAFKQVHQQLPKTTLAIHGYGNVSTQLKQQAKQENLQNVIDFVPYHQDLATTYNQAQLFVYTAESDGQPLALVEALAHGVPVVSYDINYGPREVIEDDKNGYLVPSGDINALAEKMVQVLESEQKWAKLSYGAYQSAKRYSEVKVWPLWQQLIAR
ncbi:accessory Sec system glycosyltransferase Asp1 [Loigolactobacillus rennini]|uniref:Poly(Glycerol-phosphate) alpha-glucosyltransferase n=1 Tax=Loigolactobacillus rennini DSM 20253 TaxID=1423796 RepID=A0A0R2D5X1_9LACO|nr:accessory Sec system glycosyltransferase Asp1 [Loigolactobacillus rennini]KRM98818.1 poly(glycerol-phosphate) alpha-glucosyltransferase [Loigolactobacillus rennini DSM 20253]